MDNEVAEARARLAAKFGNVQLGGKGRWISTSASLHGPAFSFELVFNSLSVVA